MDDESRLYFTPYGGFGEIGMNSMSYAYGEDMVLVDCGLMFPEDYHLGIDVVIPRFDHLLANKHKLRGIVLTHGHEDHIGALPWLVPHLDKPAIYGSSFTLALVEHKLRERDLLDHADLRLMEPGSELRLGAFTFHFFPVCHSIIEGFSLGIETPVGRVLHTGDFKIDANPLNGPGTDLEAISHFAGEKGVKLLLSDSTNVESEGHSMGEREVLSRLRQAFVDSKGRIIVTLFSSNIQRIQEVFDCAEESGRMVAVAGRSLLNNIEMASNLGQLRVPEGIFLDLAKIPQELDDHRVVLLLTGSQGEPMSALSRIARGENKHLAVHEGDTVIMSSRLIPGNASLVNRMINQLYRQGAEVYYSQVGGIHASGHAYKEELTAMLEAARPEFFVPLHGEYRHLVKHARLARENGVRDSNIFILTDGDRISLGAEGVRHEDSIPAESILVDGKGVGDVGQAVLRERQILGDEGMVVVVVVVDELTGEILLGPEISSKGFVFEQQYSHVLSDSADIVLDVLEEESLADLEKVQDKIRSAMRRFFRRVVGRDPIVVPVVRVL